MKTKLIIAVIENLLLTQTKAFRGMGGSYCYCASLFYLIEEHTVIFRVKKKDRKIKESKKERRKKKKTQLVMYFETILLTRPMIRTEVNKGSCKTPLGLHMHGTHLPIPTCQPCP